MLSKFPWVGRTRGDHRVVHLNKMRIYSCPGAAALALKVQPFEIEACCNVLMRDIGGNKFAWFAQYRIEHGMDSIIPPVTESYTVIRPESQYEKLKRLKRSLKVYNARVRYLTNNMLALIDDNIYHGELLTCRELIDVFQRREVIVGLVPRYLCQHFFAHRKTYERVVCIEFEKKWSKPDHREVTAVRFSKPEYPEQVMRWEDNESFHLRSHGRSRPVIDLESKRIFASVKAAYRITGVRPDVIKWNCLGDLDSVERKGGGKYNFKYVRFIRDEGQKKSET